MARSATPTATSSRGELWDRLTRGSDAELRCWDDDHFEVTSWTDVVRAAEARAGAIRRAGTQPGDVVPIILVNTPATVVGLLATWLAGGVPASLPIPARGMGVEEYGQRLATICAKLGSSSILTDASLAGIVEEHTSNLGVVSWQGLEEGPSIDPEPPADDQPAFIQFSSGSTSDPKGVVLTADAIRRQGDLNSDMVDATPDDRFVSWLPLSHDMGLFGGLIWAWANGLQLTLSAPQRFVQSPRTWFDDCAESGATLTVGPNAGVRLATRAHRVKPPSGRLSLRTCIVGAEPIAWETLTTAAEVLGPSGLTMRTFMPAYGLAEATLAVTVARRQVGPAVTYVDRLALERGAVEVVDEDAENATGIVSCGTPCAGVEVRTDPSEGVGRVYFSSPSLASGYYGDEAATAEHFRDGEFMTDDLGFVRDGQLHIVRRTDDVVFVGGRNVHAIEIEAAIGALEPVRTGCCAVVDLPDDSGQRLVAVMELRETDQEPEQIARDSARVAAETAGATIHECVFLPRGTLPKTPSGKLQRFRCRELAAPGAAPEGTERVVLRAPR